MNMEHLVAAVEARGGASADAPSSSSRGTASHISGPPSSRSSRARRLVDHPRVTQDDDADANDADDGSGGEDFELSRAAFDEEPHNFEYEAPPPRGGAPQDPPEDLPSSPPPVVVDPSSSASTSWQAMFAQLRDHLSLEHQFKGPPPRLAHWMASQRRRYRMYSGAGGGQRRPTGIVVNRIRQLDSIGFEWDAPPPPMFDVGSGYGHANDGGARDVHANGLRASPEEDDLAPSSNAAAAASGVVATTPRDTLIPASRNSCFA